MKTILLGCAAVLLLASPAGAQDLPPLGKFLTGCSRDATACQLKLKDYVTAATSQKVICLPKDVSVREAASELLRWLRSDAAQPSIDRPYDDVLYEASLKLYPCAPAEPAVAPPQP